MGEKFAVLIAIEHYHDRRWGSVSFAEADARELSTALGELGFESKNQQILIDAEATKARIDSRLRRAVEQLCKDDELVIYYAGHGFSDANRNYLTCHDSEVSDIVRTSISLQDIFDFVRSSESRRIMIFLDSCHSGPVVREEDRGLVHEMTENQLRQFFKDSEYYVCFSSCKTSEKSYPSGDFGHGIWTYHLLEALRGKASEAIERDGLITSRSLQNYLATQVRLSLRKIRTDWLTQTPVLYGSMTKEFVVADVNRVVDARRATVTAGIKTLKRVAFCSERRLRVKSLSGFKKGHWEPGEINDYSIRFLNSISTEEIEGEVEEARTALRKKLNYSRKQLDINIDVGAATIFTPDFSLEITLTLDESNPSQAILRWEIVNITNPKLIFSEAFNRTFEHLFSIIEFEYSQAFDISDMIDRLEEAEDTKIDLDYPKDNSYCQVDIEGLQFSIVVTPFKVRLEYKRPGSPKFLLDGLNQANQLMLREHGFPLLSN